VEIKDPWIRATAPGQIVGAGYMKITSATPSALVSVNTPVAARAELHQMSMEAGVMKMRPVARIELPAGKTVELEPGGYHLMLMNIAKPLRPGETVPITLVIEGPGKKRTEVEINAEVRDLMGGMSSHGHGKMH
jgi:copper(I)-binding protein